MGYSEILDTLLTANISPKKAEIIAQIVQGENEGTRNLTDRTLQEKELISEMVQELTKNG